jgi:2-dehydropantoate 2-reductase
MRIGVVGAGAMGCLFGARLVEGGHSDVVLYDVNKPHMDAIAARGLTFEDGPQTRRVNIRATSDPAKAGKVDFIIFFCKHPDSRQAISDARSMLTDETVVWTPQNGIGNVEIIAEIVPESRIAKGLTSSTSIQTGPGQIRTNFQGETETFIYPVAGGENPVVKEAAAILTRAGLPTYLADNIDYRIWRKLCVNITLTVLTAVLNTPIGSVGESEHGQSLMRTMVREAVAVAQAKGLPLEFDDAYGYVEELRKKAFHHIGSTTGDMQNKHMTEVDAMTGAVVREGRKVGVPTPVNEAVTNLVHLLEATRADRLPIAI